MFKKKIDFIKKVIFFMFYKENYAHSVNALTVNLIHKKFYRKTSFERVYTKNNNILQMSLKIISIN